MPVLSKDQNVDEKKLVLSKAQKRLRSVNKKIRQAKTSEGEWNVTNIAMLEKKRDEIATIVQRDQQQKKEKEDFEKMTADEAIEYFKEEPVEEEENHSIPNTSHTRRLRKQILKNLNHHMMSEMMNKQMRVRINIINQLKADCELEEEELKTQQEFLEVKEFLQNNFTS